MATSTNAIALQLQKLSNQATEKSFQYNTKEANTARTWQKMMSDTSHQREVTDLKKAGLNPILSAGSSGAQSYTTSQASAQAENAANAVGNVWSSQIGADATRAAAAQSAAAMKHAAATQAAAARYAAAMQYQASVYHSDKAAEAQKYKTDQEVALKKWVTKNSFASTPTALVDKWTQNTGLSGHLQRSIKANAKAMIKNPNAYFSVAQGKNNFKLNSYGKIAVNRALGYAGLKANNTNRQLYVKANVYNDSNAIKRLRVMTLAAQAAKKTRSAVYGLNYSSVKNTNRYWSSGRR